MKLDKIRFATLIGYLSRISGQTFAVDEIVEIDGIIDMPIPEAPMMNAETLHVLMALMQEGTRKIEAIKQHRMMTGYGLKESKDAVEKYWPDQMPKLSRVELFAKLKAAGYNNDTEFHDIERFIENCFK